MVGGVILREARSLYRLFIFKTEAKALRFSLIKKRIVAQLIADNSAKTDTSRVKPTLELKYQTYDTVDRASQQASP